MRRTVFLVAVLSALDAGAVRAAPPVAASSPDGRVRIEMSLRKGGETDSVPHYRVTLDGKEVIGHSQLGVELDGGTVLGGPSEIVSVDAQARRDEYTQVTGKRRAVTAHASEVIVRLREATAPRRTWEVVLRAYDDGTAFRYRFPKQDGWDTLAIKQERTEFIFPGDAKAFALPLNGYTTSYEKRYAVKPVKDLPKDWLLGLPLLVECSGGTWAAVTEANVTEYAGLYLAPSGDGLLSARLSPLPKEPGVAVRSSLPQMNRFVRKAVKLAAENRLTITLHGCPKPTGLERAYPNLLTHEGVMNLEYDKWDKVGITPDHEVTVPFTRMLAGPLDFHQGSFHTVKPEAFKPRNDAPLVMGTPARTLASYVVYQNHLSMVADYPTAYRGHPGLPALAAIPTTWDDTKVLDAKVGEYVVLARSSSGEWHVGAMTDGKARTVRVPLEFLGPGRFTAESWRDDTTAKFGLTRRDLNVTDMDSLTLDLHAGGGAYVRIVPAK